MQTKSLSTHASAFRERHTGDDLLVLVNVWDAGTARLTESLGVRAVATTSAGVAWAHGYPDGDALPADLLLGTVRRIVRAVSVPVTIDMEGGYSDDPAEVAELVARIVEMGVVGVNLEDGARAPGLLSRKIESVKRAAAKLGADLFVNARTDVYLRGLAPDAGRVAEVLRRAAQYREAGADGIFSPGVFQAGDLEAIAKGSPLPLNVCAWPGLPGTEELRRLGVRRFSTGSSLAQALYGRARALAEAFLSGGDSDALAAGELGYADVNDFMTPARSVN